jgi:hypothetical protein
LADYAARACPKSMSDLTAQAIERTCRGRGGWAYLSKLFGPWDGALIKEEGFVGGGG